MDGPRILASSISAARIPDGFGNEWQYHSRSDRHSKVACWVVLFDLLQASALLRRHVADDKVVFGVNHTMRDFKTRRKKDLDLVVARPGDDDLRAPDVTLAGLADHYEIVLDDEQRLRLTALPSVRRGTVGSVLLALEAKACMTAHVKAKPRLYDELNSTQLTVHGASDDAAAAALVMLNIAGEFISPGRNERDLHTAPAVVNRTMGIRGVVQGVIDKVGELARRAGPGEEGYDAIGIVVVRCQNDGSAVTVEQDPPAPQAGDDFQYEQMIRRLGHIYDSRFANV